MTIELTGWQKLWDVTKSSWREFLPPAQLQVVKVSRMATGEPSQIAYSLILTTDDGTRLELEVVNGEELAFIAE
jgi:hypothetical protein